MKFRISITTDQGQVGNVLAALQEGDSKFEDLSIEAIRPLALPPPASAMATAKPRAKPAVKGENVGFLSRGAEALIMTWLQGMKENSFTTSDVRRRLLAAKFSASRTHWVIDRLRAKSLVTNDPAFSRGHYLTTQILKPSWKDAADGGNEVLQKL